MPGFVGIIRSNLPPDFDIKIALLAPGWSEDDHERTLG